MLRRFQTGWEDGNYSVVAGKVEGGESALLAMVREAKEEADINIDPSDLTCGHTMHRRNPCGEEWIDFFFLCSRWEGVVRNTEPHKCDDLSWFPRQNLPSNTIPYIRAAIERTEIGQNFSLFGWNHANV